MAKRISKSATDPGPGKLTQRQIDHLRALVAARQRGERKSGAFTLDLDKHAVNRILDAVDKHQRRVPDTLRTEEARFEELRHELSCARWTFVDLQLGEREPTVRRKLKALEELSTAARRFCNAIDTFDHDGRLGWLSVCREGAKRHRLEVEQDLGRIQSELVRLDLEKRGTIVGENPCSDSGKVLVKLKKRDVPPDEQEKLERRRNELTKGKRANERLLFAYQDYGPEGIFNNARLTADAVASWLPAAERLAKEHKTSVAEMLSSAGDEKHVRAMRWLIGDKLREIYKTFIAPNYAWGNVCRNGRQVADSPAIRFVLQTITEFGIANKRNRPYTANAIELYWPNRKGK